MKKLLLLFFFSICILNTKAQTSVYHPFPDSNAVWRGIHASIGGTAYYRQYINGDTVIAGNTYHKIYEDGMGTAQKDTLPPMPYSAGLRGVYRENLSRQVFYYNFESNQDILLYDFNSNVGDTFPCGDFNCANYIVKSIDSVFDGLGYRKRFNILDTSTGCTNCFVPVIEGVGCIYGLISGFYQPFEGAEKLSCFMQEGVLRFINDTIRCNMFTYVNDLKPQFSAFISPNPSTNKFTISLSIPIKIGTLKIFNMMGEEVYSEPINGEQVTVNTKLSSGIYFVQVRDAEKMFRGQMIKE